MKTQQSRWDLPSSIQQDIFVLNFDIQVVQAKRQLHMDGGLLLI
jgi:hypothetical protein